MSLHVVFVHIMLLGIGSSVTLCIEHCLSVCVCVCVYYMYM